MNKSEFKSAYNKLSLSEECRAGMKAQLMEKLDSGEKDNELGFTNEELLQTSREIKLSPRKRPSAARIAAVLGSAAAIIAVFAVGAGVFLNRNQLTSEQQASQAESSDPFSDAYETDDIGTEDVIDVDSIPEQMYHAMQSASGELIFQTMDITTASHSAPEKDCQNAGSAFVIRDTLAFRSILTDLYLENGGVKLYEDLSYSEGHHSTTGLTLIYRSEDGSKQVNFNVSLDPNEFIPIEVGDGGYLTPQGEPQSRFSSDTWYNFIDPECFDMSVGGVTLGGSSYYTSIFSERFSDLTQYVRVDARNVSMDEFLECVDKCTAVDLLKNHRGSYNESGSDLSGKVQPMSAWDDGKDLPGSLPAETDHGTLQLNAATIFYNYKAAAAEPWNVMGSGELDGESGRHDYTLDDAAEFSGVDVIAGMTADKVIGTGSGRIDYAAAYEGMAGTVNDEKMVDGHGVNTEMLPGDDMAQFEESRSFVVKQYYDYGDNIGEYIDAYYSTDKLDYFSGKTRTGARYCISYSSPDSDESVNITVLDNWDMRLGMMTLGRYPADASTEFAQGADGYGELFAGRGYSINGSEVYLGGFKTANGKFVVLETYNVDLNKFAQLLEQLYTNGKAELSPAAAIGIDASADPSSAEFLAAEESREFRITANKAAVAYLQNDKEKLSQYLNDPNYDAGLSDDGEGLMAGIDSITLKIPSEFMSLSAESGIYPVTFELVSVDAEMIMYLDMGFQLTDCGWKIDYIDLQA